MTMRDRLSYAVLVLAMMLTPSLALGWYPIWVAVLLAAYCIGALLLGFWIGNKILEQRRK